MTNLITLLPPVAEATGWHLAVLIPARNEEALLPRCLESIQVARAHLPAGVTSDVILVSDRSRDTTPQLARQILGPTGIVLTSEAGRVGAARARAAQAALSRSPVPSHRLWLANTDADCEAPNDWLLRQLTLAERGIAAVTGIVDVDSFSGHAAHVPDRFRSTYLLHADGTHPHVHGANLGIRGDAYLRAGGWSNLATAEDHDLWNRLVHTGLPHVSDAALRVLTSGRRIGRAPHGFADALAAHNEIPATRDGTAA